MPKRSQARSGGQILVDQLKIHGVDHAFCVPGESYLAVLDALYDARDQIRLLICRQEGGAAYMAEAYGKLTGRPGICFVTRGPGATNASHRRPHRVPGFDADDPVHRPGRRATSSSARRSRRSTTAACSARWPNGSRRSTTPSASPSTSSHAFHRAMSGRPGPVVLALPEDMLTDERRGAGRWRPTRSVQRIPAPADMATLRGCSRQAEQPLVILGGGGWTAEAVRRHPRVRRSQRICRWPRSFRCQDLFDNRHRQLRRRCRHRHQPDARRAREGRPTCCSSIGARLGEMTTSGYTLLDAAGAEADADPRPCRRRGARPRLSGRRCRSTAGMAQLRRGGARPAAGRRPRRWRDWTEAAHADYLA